MRVHTGLVIVDGSVFLAGLDVLVDLCLVGGLGAVPGTVSVGVR